jgi:hypothetical protein
MFVLSHLCSSLDGIWTHTIDSLQKKTLTFMFSALDHSTTSAPYKWSCNNRSVALCRTAQTYNSTTTWFNFETYVIFSNNLVSQITLRSSGTDIMYGCHLLRCLLIYEWPIFQQHYGENKSLFDKTTLVPDLYDTIIAYRNNNP